MFLLLTLGLFLLGPIDDDAPVGYGVPEIGGGYEGSCSVFLHDDNVYNVFIRLSQIEQALHYFFIQLVDPDAHFEVVVLDSGQNLLNSV